jgi:hypothetical protein
VREPPPLHFDVRRATYALLRQAQQALELERGERLDDDTLITALCTAAALCDGHHRALHDGKLTITGEAPNVVVKRLELPTHVGPPEMNKLAVATMQALAKQALVQLGFKAAEARAAIDRAGPRDSLEALIREALRQMR